MRARKTKPASSKAVPGARAVPEDVLLEDIRFLGRILGDVIREQAGTAAFDLVERIRRLSVACRTREEAGARRSLDRVLDGLTADQAVSVIRAFTYFSHLANLAEDRHQLRRLAAEERDGFAAEGTIERTLDRLGRRHIDPPAIARMLAAACVSPVLTAHPSEVQRKSILDAERVIGDLLGEREALVGRQSLEDNEAMIRSQVTRI